MMRKGVYNTVENQRRKDLINLMEKHGKKLVEAAAILEINYSTAKTIMRVFRNEKRIVKKNISKRIGHMFKIEKKRVFVKETTTAEENEDLSPRLDQLNSQNRIINHFPRILDEINYLLNLRVRLFNAISRASKILDYYLVV